MNATPPLRVLIVDDSPIAGEVLKGILESDSGIQVVGVARNGIEALDLAPQLAPDLVTVDVWMPKMDGFTTVEQLMAYHPTPILVITTSLARQDVDISLRMLAAGALDVIEKPTRSDPAQWDRDCRNLIRHVKTLARVRVVTHLKGRRPHAPAPPAAAPDGRPVWPLLPPDDTARSAPEAPATRPAPAAGALPPVAAPSPTKQDGAEPAAPPALPRRSRQRRIDLVVIASSTGGPQALLKVLGGLPPDFNTPLLIIQHIAAGFTQGLADWLTRETGRPVRLASAGERPGPGDALLAPDGRHMLLGPDGRIILSDGPPREIRPSADVTMGSVATSLGARALGVVLTGMGRDGAEGLRAMRHAGAYTIAQDEPSSIIFGMPRAAIALGAADEVEPLDHIAARIAALAGP